MHSALLHAQVTSGAPLMEGLNEGPVRYAGFVAQDLASRLWDEALRGQIYLGSEDFAAPVRAHAARVGRGRRFREANSGQSGSRWRRILRMARGISGWCGVSGGWMHANRDCAALRAVCISGKPLDRVAGIKLTSWAQGKMCPLREKQKNPAIFRQRGFNCGGATRSRTGLDGFAIRCITDLLSRLDRFKTTVSGH